MKHIIYIYTTIQNKTNNKHTQNKRRAGHCKTSNKQTPTQQQ